MNLRTSSFALSALALMGASAAHAQTIFSDNFSDGNDVGWSRFELGGTFSSTWSIVGGEYRHRTATPVPNTGGPGMITAWTNAFNDASPFQHGYLRAKARIMSGGTSAGLFLRSDLNFYTYTFVLSQTTGAGIIYVGTADGVVELGRFPIAGGVTLGTAYMMEAGAVGPKLSFKVWRADAQDPGEAQLEVTDHTHSGPGVPGMYEYLSVLWPIAATIEARFDDVTFTQASYCPADFDGDGTVDFFDYDVFVGAFESGSPQSDFDGDGTVDFFDYDAFVLAFEAGC